MEDVKMISIIILVSYMISIKQNLQDHKPLFNRIYLVVIVFYNKQKVQNI